MIEKTKLGMLLFIASEAVFFASLILAYIYYSGFYDDWPNGVAALQPLTTGIFTLALLSSSATLWLAERSQSRGRRSGLRLWLLTTIVLGAIFLIGQGFEYAHLIENNVTIGSNLFGSTFFTLTGFHGLHVFSGLVALAILLGLALSRRSMGRAGSALVAVGWYWHFVDVVWVVIFSLVYLWPIL